MFRIVTAPLAHPAQAPAAMTAATAADVPESPAAATPESPGVVASEASPAAIPVTAAPALAAPASPAALPQAWFYAVAATAVLGVVAITLAVQGQQRTKALEQELVRRQQDSQGQAIEAHALAKQAQEIARAMESKVALLDGRVAETALQRSQLEDLIQQLSRSRDENVLADIDAALRVAVQQTAITGSAEPLGAALRQAEQRLARMNQPRVERVRRALARDLDRTLAVSVADIATLTIKLDEAVRSVDELPLLAQAERRTPAAALATRPAASAPAAASVVALNNPASWLPWVHQGWDAVAGPVWREVKGLIRVTRIDNPEAMLVAPEQAWFLRENLKLRLLNARLALMSRQFDAVQSDLRDVQSALDRYFDRSSRRTALTADLLRQVTVQARQLNVPRPDESLAALAAAQAGR